MESKNGGRPLKASALKPYLQECGYRSSLLRENFVVSPQITIPLLAFGRAPADARSACVAVVEAQKGNVEQVANLREVAAPVVFVCGEQGLEWWQQSTSSPRRIGGVIPPDRVPQFFEEHASEFGPDVVYRAKTWGRFNAEFQLTFVDLGLMPLIESEIGHRLEQLIARSVQDLKAALDWQTISEKQGYWLLKVVFWLISAKVLKDKDVAPFRHTDLLGVEETLDAVASHFGTDRIALGDSRQRKALGQIASSVASFANLQMATTESLAYVYENTLISKATRQALGTHSTPPYLVDYIVGRLRPWIEEVPIGSRNVYEPACGHGAFLVSAMRLLTELLPKDKSAPQQRRNYLRTRVHGSDIDAFALEIARLSLSLTDIPNPNGWDLVGGDVFLDNRLEAQAKSATILLTNPPFENFSAAESKGYGTQKPRYINKTAELLSRVLPQLSPGSVVGLVTPQGFLHSKNATDVRRELLKHFEIQEICLFPDKVFSFSDVESSVIIARKVLTTTKSNVLTRYRRIRERDIDAFRDHYAATTDRTLDLEKFASDQDACLHIPDLAEVWDHCKRYSRLGQLVEIGQGFIYKGEQLPPGSITYSDKPFAGAVEGFVHFEKRLMIHQLPNAKWLNLDKKVIRRPVHGLHTGTPQILLNGSRTSRGPWRLKGLLDETGHPVTSRFLVVRPLTGSKYPLEFFWALCNSIFANAFAYCHFSKRDNVPGVMSEMPVPDFDEARCGRIVAFTHQYFAAMQSLSDGTVTDGPHEEIRQLLFQIDRELLQMYSLPEEMEFQLMRLFTGWKRGGVPFRFEGYFPEEFSSPISLADLIAITDDWNNTNRRRDLLIRRKVDKTLKADEKSELDKLQRLATIRRRLVAPLPIKEMEAYLQELKQGAVE